MRLEAEDEAPVAFELFQQANCCERPIAASAVYTIHTDVALRTLYSGMSTPSGLPIPHRFSA